jgi:hypothetical protein
MKSTQLKKGRKWNSMIQGRTAMGKNGPFQMPRFSNVYLLRSVSEENSKGSWHGWDVSLEGPVTDGALYGQARTFAESINRGDVQVKHSRDDEGGSAGGGSYDSDEVPF